MRSSSSNGGRNGFFGYLKGLFRKDETTKQYDAGESSVSTDTLPLTPPPVEVGLAASAPAAPPTRPTPPPAPAATNQNVDRQGAGFSPGISLPLKSVVDAFTPELRQRVTGFIAPDLTVSFAIDKILAQLPQGQVRVPFGDIRKAVPQVFASGVEFDRVSVALPLNEVLSRLNPALLVRRPAARQVEVPEDITSPFEGKGNGLSVGNAKPVPPAAPRKPAAPVPQVPARGSVSSVPRHTPPGLESIPAPFSFGPAKTKPAAPTPAAPETPAVSEAAVPFAPKPPVAPAAPTATPLARPAAPAPAAAPAPIPFPSATPAPVAQSQPKPVETAKPAATAVITIPISSLMEGWPEPLRLEILQTNLNDARIALPMDLVEGALKRGRVVFPWKTIRSWVSPAVPTTVSAHDNAELELPLKIIAPLFLARKQTAPSQVNKVTVDETIPNLFFGFPQPEAAAPAAPAPSVLAAPAAPSIDDIPDPIPFKSPLAPAAASTANAGASVPAAVPVQPAAAKPVDTNYYLWEDASETRLLHIEALKQKGTSGTEFVKRYASPNEIVSRAVALEGVAGALIALPDGLMVASRIPADLNGETLAGFLPQIFAKVSSCTKELRMGELNNVSFTVGNVPWKIFRVNAIFFAAFGHAGQPMPTAQLVGLAAELDRKNK